MSYRLVIAEKPSVGAAYAKVLGATNRQDGYWEGNGYLVSWCIGHLVELAPPNVYDEKFVKWSVADLPILPEKWQYLVSASTKKQFAGCAKAEPVQHCRRRAERGADIPAEALQRGPFAFGDAICRCRQHGRRCGTNRNRYPGYQSSNH